MACKHWHSELDNIGIKFKCCGNWFPCFQCHEEIADHEPAVWPSDEFGQRSIMCFCCRYTMTISEYLNCQAVCPSCAVRFNPGCENHYHLYFEMLQK